VKLEREKESTQEETRGLCGVLHVMDSQNKELKERVKELEIKLKKANRENSKLKKKQKKIIEDDLTIYIVSLQSKTEEQAEEIERLLTEKETLPNHSESQTRNTRKKTEILEQLLENKHKPTTIVNTRPPTNTLPVSNPSTTVLDEEIIRLKLEILFAKRSFEEEKLCVVCQDAEKVMAFVPCGHKCACEICSIGLSACPLCRIPCEFKCRIYQ